MAASDSRQTVPLWWLPLAAGALPALATVVAFQLAVAQGQFPSCNPFVEGCVSISRAARHDLPNILFRGLMLPAATLQGLVWWLAPIWLRRVGAPQDRWLTALPWVGVTAAVFLVLYTTFLGTEVAGSRWVRRYGVIVYFGFTCIAMVIAGGAVQKATAAAGRLRHAGMAILALCAALPLLGIANTMSPLLLDAAALDAFENITEWWAATVFHVFFVLLGWLWRVTGFSAAPATHAG